MDLLIMTDGKSVGFRFGCHGKDIHDAIVCAAVLYY